MKSSIEVNALKKTLGGNEILKGAGVSFQVEKGDIFGFLGPNGAGKTTTIRTLLGLYHPNSGNAKIMGFDAVSDEARQNVGFMIDGDGLYDDMSAFSNIVYYLKLYGKAVNKSQINRVLSLVGLENRAKDKTGTFSKGMRQKLSLARALSHNPAVLILDEPTSGLDPTAQIEFRNIMLDIAKKEQKTVLLSSHNLDEVQKICNRIALLNKGEVRLYGNLSELRQQMGRDTVVVQTNTIVSELAYQRLKAQSCLGLQGRNGKILIFVPPGEVKVPEILEALVREKIEMDEFNKNEASLEEMYTSIVKEG